MTLLLGFPLYFACLAILSYVVSSIGLPLTRVVYLILTTVSIVLTYVLTPTALKRSSRSRFISLAAFIPCLIAFTILAIGFRQVITPPHNADAGNHFYMIDRILTAQTLKHQIIFDGYTIPSWYPLGLHNLIASWMSLYGTTDLLEFVFPAIWIITALFPLSVTYFTYQLGHHRTTAILAGFVSLTFFMYPFNVLTWGGWSMIAGLTMMWFALGQTYRLIDMLGSVPLNQHRSLAHHFLILIILLNGLYLIHTTEVLTYLMLLPAILLEHRRIVAAAVARYWTRLIPVVILNAVLVAPFFLAGYRRLAYAAPTITANPHDSITAAADTLYQFHLISNRNYLLMMVFVISVIYLQKRPRYRSVVINAGLIFLTWLVTVITPLLDSVYRVLFPWLEPERTYYTLGIFYAFITAEGIRALFQSLDRLRGSQVRTMRIAGAIAGLAIALAIPIASTATNMQNVALTFSPTRKNDVELLRRNRERCPIYLNEPVGDAGRFIPFLTGNRVIFHGPSDLLPDYSDHLALLEAVASESAYPQLKNLMLRYQFDCIYIGANQVRDIRPHLELPRLVSNPYLSVLDEQGGSAILTVSQTPHQEDGPVSTTLPVMIEAGDIANMRKYLIGDLPEVTHNPGQATLQPVGATLDLYTRFPLKEFYLTGQSTTGQTQLCTLTINNAQNRSLVLPSYPAKIGFKDLNLKPQQNHIHIVCPTNSDSSNRIHFYISSIQLQ